VFRHILVATDFSMPSTIAVSSARDLAHKLDASLTVLHVHAPDADTEVSRLALEEVRSDVLGSLSRVEVVSVAHPRPDVAICGQVVASKADLVVAGRHGEHGVAERLLGSTTERVVRHAPCSVLVEHPARSEPFHLLKHVLVATDFSESSEPAIEAAGALGRSFEAWVTLMHVYDVLPPVKVLEAPHESHEGHSFRELCETELQKLQQRFLDGVPGAVEVLRDKSTVTALCDWAGDKEVDLMVVGSHGRTGVARLLLGSISERTIRHAPASVLMVRVR
jgi:nucleotide-binding universal stress UspA family protein